MMEDEKENKKQQKRKKVKLTKGFKRLAKIDETLFEPDENLYEVKFSESMKSAIKGFMSAFTFKQISGRKVASSSLFIQLAREQIMKVLEKELKRKGAIKFNIGLSVRISKEKVGEDGEIEFIYSDDDGKPNPSFHSVSQKLLNSDRMNMVEMLDGQADQIQKRIDLYTRDGLYAKVDKIMALYINSVGFQPLQGSSYIPLDPIYANTKSCVNIKNEDQRCFDWCIKAHLYPAVKDACRVSKYKSCPDLDETGIEYPFPANNSRMIERYEKNNNLAINIFEGKVRKFKDKEGEEVAKINPVPLYISKNIVPPDRVIDLLWIEENGGGEEFKSHYVLIKDFDKMMFTLTKTRKKVYFCKNCLSHFYSTDARLKHFSDGLCRQHDAVKVILPQLGKHWFEFKNYKHKQEAPFIIVCDFESYLEPSIDLNEGCATEKVNLHKNMSYGMIRLSSVPEFTEKFEMERRSVEEDEQTWSAKFIDRLFEEAATIKEIMKECSELFPEPVLTSWEEQNFKKAKRCHICEKHFKDDDTRVRDHDHLTGEYRGAAHEDCNLHYNCKNYKIPVIFHNLKGYDGHQIIRSLTLEAGKRNISVIAQNEERFMTFTVGNLKFIDSLNFLSSGLGQLVEDLASGGMDKFQNLKQNFPANTRFDLLTKKGIYPYEYIDSLEKMNETQLPPMKYFYSSLRGKPISEEDYSHAQEVWQVFGCKNLGDYHDLYLKTDVLLLADVIQNFRHISRVNYKLDPMWYVSLPGYAIDVALLKTSAKIELFHNEQYEMHLFSEEAMRGGYSCIIKRYAKANNKYMDGQFDKSLPSKYLIYLDANNLYGYPMTQPLPTGNYQWEDASKFTSEYILSLKDDASNGYILDVDLEYPKELHELHNDYPFCVEKKEVKMDELSEYQLNHLEVNQKKYVEGTKLVSTLTDKVHYKLHYRLLKQALQAGLKLKKVHKVLSFSQKPWLEPYIMMNMNFRAKSKNEFEKGFFKLMNNSVFGKLMENVRKRIDYRIVMNETSARNYAARPTYRHCTIIKADNPDYPDDPSIVGIMLKKNEVKLDKPIICGVCVFDVSKLVMYDFHYNTIKKRYGYKARLLFTDTDSLMYEIETEDVYKDMAEDSKIYDTSDYPKDHHLYSVVNKKVIGKFKDESNGNIIDEFVGLRSKMYSYRMFKDPEEKHQRLKGVSKDVVENEITHKRYKECLLTSCFEHKVDIYSLRSYNHNIYTIKQKKTGLCAFDDKRYILENGQDTLAYGHHAIQV